MQDSQVISFVLCNYITTLQMEVKAAKTHKNTPNYWGVIVQHFLFVVYPQERGTS